MVLLAAGCASKAAPTSTTLALRPACPDAQLWDGATCKPPAGAAQLAAGTQALAELRLEDAKAALDAAEQAGPLDHARNVTLWEQRAITAAYGDDEPTAKTAFDMLLALDPAHVLSYALSPKATLVFEQVVQQARTRPAPAIDVNWERGQKVGDPIPVDVEVLADPKRFLARATLFVRTRGEAAWRAADVPLATAPAKSSRVVIPAIAATKPLSLELYLRAYDDRGNEVLAWAAPNRPRELALRYEPPTPWYRTWWGITTIVGVSAVVVGGIVYAVTLAPPDKVGGDITVRP